ncbi:lysophospholipase [Variovorax sp. J22G21]|uniref:lysophospholipase n=1 Tax=Variovorax fucosicus TaxID=3053517 RepID=UPI002575C92C|nr:MULTISPECIES: lysophospholipase [unclassified Variovorax]MDM0037860.1 lysophospholipase [Variovorax sp. J22R193]MDM0062636.1 lysophospholipase [Variovorax sp. J22G21]
MLHLSGRIAAAACALVVGSGAGIAAAASIGGPLNLADEGMFFVNGKPATSRHPGVSPAGPVPPGTVTVNQMYVHYRIPANRTSAIPIVLVHGGGLSGMSYETTPDGREGWATYFARKGHAVYVVDTPGRGRSGFNATAINEARAEGSVSGLPASVLMVTAELAWPLFRFGPSRGTAYSDTQFPVEAFPAFASQGVPFAEAMLEGGGMGTAPQALAALLDDIGPAIVMVHSLAGPFADAVVGLRPTLVKAVVNIEGAQSVVPTDPQIAAYKGVPVLELFGDHLDAPVFTGQPRYEARKAVVERINRLEGGRANLVRLPDVGLKGNSHMMMQDRNNLQVADFILGWIADKVR